MRTIRIICLALLIQTVSYSQTDVTQIVDSVVARARATSMFSNSVNWDSLKVIVYQKAEGARSIQDLKPSLEALLNGLRDQHGRFIDASNYSTLASFTQFKSLRFKDSRPKDIETWKVVNDTSLRFEFKILKPNIGYLKIVGIAPNVDIEIEAKKIRNALLKLSTKKVSKWIVDLRYNGGGNFYPMVSGIAPLIGEGVVGKLVSSNLDTLFTWSIKNGNFTYDIPDLVVLPNKPTFQVPPKVAVLTSRWTASSGELVATCFKGRINTKFFGEATAGYASNTGWEIIDNQIIMVISTGFFCDRKGVVCDTNIPVDVEVPFAVEKDVTKDSCIKKAIGWLQCK